MVLIRTKEVAPSQRAPTNLSSEVIAIIIIITLWWKLWWQSSSWQYDDDNDGGTDSSQCQSGLLLLHNPALCVWRSLPRYETTLAGTFDGVPLLGSHQHHHHPSHRWETITITTCRNTPDQIWTIMLHKAKLFISNLPNRSKTKTSWNIEITTKSYSNCLIDLLFQFHPLRSGNLVKTSGTENCPKLRKYFWSRHGRVSVLRTSWVCDKTIRVAIPMIGLSVTGHRPISDPPIQRITDTSLKFLSREIPPSSVP